MHKDNKNLELKKQQRLQSVAVKLYHRKFSSNVDPDLSEDSGVDLDK